MPFFKADDKMVYYAHVPKCAGSAIARYLKERFGPLGFYDVSFHKKRARNTAWSATSPQHVDVETLQSLIPLSFFKAMFAVVRHPVSRTLSAFHFQREVEGRIPADLAFSDWLQELETVGFARFDYDNHILPMNLLVPEGASIFHLEYGLDPLIVWLDELTGNQAGPRVILRQNARGALVAVQSDKVTPTAKDIARISRIYAADFARFGYHPDQAMPAAPPPEISEGFLAERDRALKTLRHPFHRLRQRLRRQLNRL